MNAYAVVILAALAAEYALARLADLLNVRSLDAPVPEEFRDVVDEEAHLRIASYTRSRTALGIAASTADLVLLLLFWFGGGFGWLDDVVRQWHLGAIGGGVAYAALLVLGRSVVSLPFSIMATFGIEQRFGFNKTTPATFVADRLKAAAVGALLGGPILAGVIWLFASAGPAAWLLCWGAVTIVMLVVQYVAPTWLMPIFNKFTPLPDGELRTAIETLARQLRFPLEGVYVMDGSKRSTKANAFFTGFGGRKRIVLFDTLLGRHSAGELVAVLAHEIGHYKKKHVLVSLALGILHTGLLLWLLSIALDAPGLFEAFYVRERSVYVGLILLGLLLAPAEFFIGLVLSALSRRHEYAADRYAAEATRRPDELIGALKKLSRDNAAHLTPHRLYVVLHYGHPPVVERIRALTGYAAAQSLPGGG
jgi:STE24 endopeptidase